MTERETNSKSDIIKPTNTKNSLTPIANSSLNSSDIYVEIKKIPIDKSSFKREGDNGINVPHEYFPTKIASISANKIISVFKSCSIFTFNMSNRDSNNPVSCVSSLGDSNSIFINLHQKNNSGLRLCEDKSNLRIGHILINLPDEVVADLTSQAKLLFDIHTSPNNESRLLKYFNYTSNNSFLDIFWNFYKLFKTKKKINPHIDHLINDNFIDSYFVNQKKINTFKVYP